MESTGIPFWKASACGNDFLIIDAKFAPADVEEFTRQICNRNLGVGADGVEWVYPGNARSAPDGSAERFDLRLRLINADGSHAELSGNGTRCVAAWHLAQRAVKASSAGGTEVVRIATDAGVKTCELISRNGREFTFRTAMGCPVVGEPFSLQLRNRSVSGVPVDMGNPQFLVFVEEFPEGWQKIASEIQSHAECFPEGVNVEFVQVRSESEIAIRIFERGAGETSSSGTGSSASAAATIAVKGLRSRLEVHAPGGSQIVEWMGEPAAELFLYGPARLVCRGEFFI